ncbi:MAG: hypothetical protein ACOYVG_07330 [Bacteroidota bacterium]
MNNNNQGIEKLLEKKGMIPLVIVLFIIAKGILGLFFTDPRSVRMFNLVATSLMFLLLLLVVHYKTKTGEAVKYRPLLYIGVLIYLAFAIFILYLHFTT